MEVILTQKQKDNFKKKELSISSHKKKEHTTEEIILLFLAERPDEWFFTWELMGQTKWGFLSHATHASLRVAEQKNLIVKDYINGYVVYTHKNI